MDASSPVSVAGLFFPTNDISGTSSAEKATEEVSALPASGGQERGFHPIHLGDTFNDRYHIIKQLGRGSYSTVWLVEDFISSRFAALKVIVADFKSSEIAVARHLKIQQEQPNPHPGWEYVVKIYDTFEFQGPNGMHQCIVTEVLGPSLDVDLSDFNENYVDRLPSLMAKKVVGQVARGVAYLHKCGVVHGDLHYRNVLFYSPKLKSLTWNDLKRYFGDPSLFPDNRTKSIQAQPPPLMDREIIQARSPPLIDREIIQAQAPPLIDHETDFRKLESGLPEVFKIVVGEDGVPVIDVKYFMDSFGPSVSPETLELIKLCLSSPEDVHIKICDFGESSFFNRPKQEENVPIQLHMPKVLAAPEVFFEDIYALTPPTEIWSLAVLIHMIICDKTPLFDPYFGSQKHIMPIIVQALGKLPEKWWTKWTDRATFFDDSGAYIGPKEMKMERFTKVWPGTEDGDIFVDLLRKMVRYEMKDRITADEVVELLPSYWKS